MTDLETAKKEVKQVQAFIIILALLQIAILVFAMKNMFAGLKINYIGLAFTTIALILNIVAFIGLNQYKKYGLQVGYVIGAITLITSLIGRNIIGLIVALIWLWSFYRIKPALIN